MNSNLGIANDPLWYKDAVIYQVHVKTFFDSNSDGYGDFQGLIQKLDHIQALGADCIWLLPFFPSPLKDDGYDISDYTGINPVYGDERDFRRFLDEAHLRGIRVIVELVVNHTSDQHPWFQAARHSPKGSPERDFYVWSDTNDRYKNVRIIFTDSENSNWTWDAVAQQYYWHRFFHHQPDLNFDNPRVVESIERFLYFWLEMGVDGFRLDAVPYLIEREGTTCESLPETHQILKRLRQIVDENFQNRILLAEANLWPSEVRDFFGSGDECHMAFHFPLMPRIFMAVHQEDRHPIVEIMNQTPALPANCQWAIFLRNHDELTLEMVSDEERDYMYEAYAADPIMRINLGIRRRLAPLMENNRKCIELMNNLLLSMPGTPVIYYGDEIGMGDNVFQGDRNGVRTPMQWTGDRNAGFSSAPFAKLYSAPIMDAVFGYQAINVESQNLDPSSLLNWMKQILRLRKNHKVFSRGSISFLHPANRKILAYLRSYDGQDVLVVSNLSRYSQSVELDLSNFHRYTPVEMFGLAEFPVIESNRLYPVMLGPHAFYWLLLRQPSVPETDRSLPRMTSSSVVPTQVKAERLPTIEVDQISIDDFLKHDATLGAIRQYLSEKSWCQNEQKHVSAPKLVDCIYLEEANKTAIVIICFDEDKDENENSGAILLILTLSEATTNDTSSPSSDTAIALLSDKRGRYAHVIEGVLDQATCQKLYSSCMEQRKLTARYGHLEFSAHRWYEELKVNANLRSDCKQLPTTGSSISINYFDSLLFKLLRNPGQQDSTEALVRDELTESPYRIRVPKIAGILSYQPASGNPLPVAVLQEFVTNEGDAWRYTVEELQRYYGRVGAHMYLEQELLAASKTAEDLIDSAVPEAVSACVGIYLRDSSLLGQSLAKLHLSLSNSLVLGPQRFLRRSDLVSISDAMRYRLRTALQKLKNKVNALPEQAAVLSYELIHQEPAIDSILESIASITSRFTTLDSPEDLHLGQLLRTAGNFTFTSLTPLSRSINGENNLSLKNIAVILRSFHYATQVSLQLFSHDNVTMMCRFQPWAKIADRWICAVFLREYLKSAGPAQFLPENRDELMLVLRCLLVNRALSELLYELNYRQDWLRIPLQSLIDFSQLDA